MRRVGDAIVAIDRKLAQTDGTSKRPTLLGISASAAVEPGPDTLRSTHRLSREGHIGLLR